jgi:hypothetical protein
MRSKYRVERQGAECEREQREQIEHEIESEEGRKQK